MYMSSKIKIILLILQDTQVTPTCSKIHAVQSLTEHVIVHVRICQ